MDLRGLVRAVLVPHGGEDSELGERGLAADQRQNALVFFRLEAVLGDEFGRNLNFAGHYAAAAWPKPIIRRKSTPNYAAWATCATRPANSPRPSVGPTAASTWFSGCGIRPSTLRFSESTPAIALVAPLKFQFGSGTPAGDV